jgi:glutamyl-tRNA synthetase
MSTLNSKIRVRFAPSPTGDPHIGNIRSALFNWLFARHFNGEFILRIEDTDKNRAIEGSLEKILENLKWLGLNYDKNPYIQSERLDIYKKYVEKLLKEEKAYYCFCSSERLEKMRKEQTEKKQAPKYDRKCLSLTKEEIEKNLKEKIPYTVRLKIPEGETKFKDLIRGEVSFQNKEIDDQILLKSDGFPTYHLANVVDDHLMEISHVIRGEEWISSAPKHIILYKTFGWEPPKFAHLPIILGPDKSKLSKRHGAVSVLEYRGQGYLPDALINFMVLLGWNPKTEQEIFSREELIKQFSLDKVQKSSAVFDIKKLDWINGQYIRKIDLDKLTEMCIPYLEKAGLIETKNSPAQILPARLAFGDSKTNGQSKKCGGQEFKIEQTGEEIDFDYLKKVIALEQERMKKISEIPELVGFVFTDKLNYKPELLKWKKMDYKAIYDSLTLSQEKIYKISEKTFFKENIEKSLREIIKNNQVKLNTGELLWPLRAALTGLKFSPGPFEVAEVLGKEKCLERIKEAKKMIEKK